MFVFTLALVPSLAVLLYVYHRDRHPEPWGSVAAVFCAGALACFPAYHLERFLQTTLFPETMTTGSLLFFECLMVPGLVEESLKLLVVLAIVWWRPEFDEPVDAIIYGTAAALGFTFGEDLRRHLVFGPDWTRLFTTIAHPLFSCFWAASLGWAMVLPRRQGLGLVVLGWAASVTVHALFDFFILSAEADTAYAWMRHLLMPLLVGLYVVIEHQLEVLQPEKPAGESPSYVAHPNA